MTLNNFDQPTNIRPNEGFDQNSLKSFLINELNLIEGIIKISQFPSGFSNLTYLVNFNETDYVLRRPPIGANIKSGHDMKREYTILNGLKKIYNKVPKPYIYSDNLKIIGAPFYLMERKKGIILRGNTPKKQLPDKLEMRNLSKKFIFTLAEIHRLNYKKAGLESLGKPIGYISRQVKGWINRYLASKTSDISNINYVYKWLDRNIHENKFSSLIHNDFKYDNLVLSDDGKYDVLAILDWEMATLGDPLMDLGTSLGYWIDKTDPENIQQNKFNITNAEGNLNRGELVSLYSKESKLDISNIVFYYVFGLFKIAVIVQQIFYRYKLGKTSDKRFKDLNEIEKFMD
tara:strand:+ start:125 stop:1159 length:1035 start_codon:yes stop_codon:yes gene_type:complete